VSSVARVKEWWGRAIAVLWAPRAVFSAMRRDGEEERQEPAVVLTLLAGLLAVLSTPRFAGLLDEAEVDGLSLAVFALVGAVGYALVGYFVLGAALALGAGGGFRRARHVVAYAAAPLGLALLVLWLLRLTAYGGDPFREGGSDGGPDGTAFALAELGFAAWALGLLIAGARYALGLPWGRAAATCVLPATLAVLAVWFDRF
jgi:hypothetical protein